MRTPIRLETLDNEHAVFRGSAEETFTRTSLVGEVELSQHYPAVMLQRSIWEDIGRPVAMMLTLEAIEVNV